MTSPAAASPGTITSLLQAIMAQGFGSFWQRPPGGDETPWASALAPEVFGDVAAVHGIVIDALFALDWRGRESNLRLLLTEHQHHIWTDRLRDLLLLLKESGALRHNALLYGSDDTLMCELGPSGRTLSLAIDDEGVSLSFRQRPDDFDSYVSRSWDNLPPLDEFMQLLADYSGSETHRRAWMNLPTLKSYSRTKSSGAAFATTQATPSSTFETEAFASS